MTLDVTAPVHFLIVDDLEENLLALEALLRRDGLVILRARTGLEALELLLKHEIALALVDVQMPEMDGFELAELMRGSARTARVPIIFLTAGAVDRERWFRGYEAGAVDFLHKPIEPDVLRGKAAVFFELRRQQNELRAATDENARLLQESRQHADALKAADRRKDEFLAMLAHELRNPLAPIRNAVQLLRISSDDEEAVRSASEMMERQLGQMVRLVDDLLDVSRISRGRIELRREVVELALIVRHAVEAVEPMALGRDQKLIVATPDEPIFLSADSTRLAQVIGNLLNNACKFTDSGGSVSLSVERAGSEALVRIRDSGIGIAPEELPQIFDMFTQLDTSLERRQSGLGIGLTLVRTLVELHGGSVSAHSDGPGRGSEFVVRLPVLPATTRKPSSPSVGSLSPVTHRRILVVDDNRDAAFFLSKLLSRVGHETHTAHDGVEAVAAAAAFRPHIVLLDIGLPTLNGYEVARKIREQPEGRQIALVALTGWGQDEDRRKSQEAGFDGHLVKPVDFAVLTELLAELPRTPSD